MTLINESPVLGNHIIIECYGEQSRLSIEALEALMRKAAHVAGATVLGSNMHAFGPGCGNTGVLLLAESHLSVHTWPEHNYAAFDVFMCGDDKPLKQVIDIITSCDAASTCYVKTIKRGLGPAKAQDPKSMTQELIKTSPLLIDKVVERVAVQDRDQAVTAIEELVKFLMLCSSSQTRCVPSLKIDQVWHEFILFTASYAAFCQKHLTRFIHHTPSADAASDNDYADYQATLIRYQNLFGQPCEEFWPNGKDYLTGCGFCTTE